MKKLFTILFVLFLSSIICIDEGFKYIQELSKCWNNKNINTDADFKACVSKIQLRKPIFNTNERWTCMTNCLKRRSQSVCKEVCA